MERGERLGPYEIVEPIGAGGMGEVWRAHDTRLARDVAIKVLPASLAAEPERVRRFEREARVTGSLNHPNILAIYDIGIRDGSPFLVEELLEGETLRKALASGALPVRRAVEVAVHVANGLAAAHGKGIVHRDLKPENLFVTNEGHVKILDFGLAKLVEKGLPDEKGLEASTLAETTEAGMVLGTVGYMAPEQVRGQPVDHRADIFALGCVLYEMLSGRRAFFGATVVDALSAILKEDPPRLPDQVEPTLRQVVGRCLEKRPDDRFSSAHDLGLALEAVSTGFRVGSRSSSRGARAASVGTERPGSLLAHVPSRVRRRGWRWLLAGLVMVAALVAVVRVGTEQYRAEWVRNDALPRLVGLVEARNHWEAFLLAREIEQVVPGDPTLQELRPQFCGAVRRRILPAGANVLARPRLGDGVEWIELGKVGGEPLTAPLGYSVFKVGSLALGWHELAMSVSGFGWDSLHIEGTLVLARQGELRNGMVRIDTPPRPMRFELDDSELDFLDEGHLSSFLVDIHEVTNRAYKRFVDAGGYQRREYWKEPLKLDGRSLTWDDAMKLFRDATGRPGPAGWELGSFPPGKGEFPVTGVSWYEASAYAAFAGKRLPSVYHWSVASAWLVGGDFVRGSNFAGTLAPVGSHRGSLNYWGLYDVAGNAQEWCSNASGSDRLALGGGCDGPAYMFWEPVSKSPFERSPTTGFRCVTPVAADSRDVALDAPVERKAAVDWAKEKPFSDDTWRTWQDLLAYAKTPLEARVEWTDDTLPLWRMEKVSFRAAYGGERVVAYVFLPRSVPPPWQTVVVWPGSYAALVGSSDDGKNTLDTNYWSFLVKDGRAVLYPILKGTFERGGSMERVREANKEERIIEAKDVFRSIDYLETRPDVLKNRLGYLGLSWGANNGPFVCAVEKRIKAAVLAGGGLYEPEMLGFVHRSTTPTLMINGRADGYAERQAPMFRALGAPADLKRHVVFDSDHTLAGYENESIRVSLEWFDRFLGPVR